MKILPKVPHLHKTAGKQIKQYLVPLLMHKMLLPNKEQLRYQIVFIRDSTPYYIPGHFFSMTVSERDIKLADFSSFNPFPSLPSAATDWGQETVSVR